MALDDLTKVAGTSCEEIVTRLDSTGIDYRVIDSSSKYSFIKRSEVRLINFYPLNDGVTLEFILGKADALCFKSKRVRKCLISTAVYFAYYGSDDYAEFEEKYRLIRLSKEKLLLVEITYVSF